jgi:predicted enzyme related to lactoylglutathione lyase
MHGQFCWYELTSPDVNASKKFYTRLTGWGTQAFDKNYTMFTAGGDPIAGVFPLNDEMRSNGVPPNWMPYVESTNVDDTVAKARSLGGAVVAGPDDVPGVGRYAVVRDPQGATFGVYRSARQSGGWDGRNVVGRFSWHELMTSDYQKAFDFYSALFGWNRTTEMDIGGGNMYQVFGQGEAQYGGMFNKMPGMESMPPFWLVYIHVDDVGKAVASATQNGAFVQRERTEIPGGTIAILGDPTGAGFALHDTRSMPSAATPTAKAGGAMKKAAATVAKAVSNAVRRVTKPATKTNTKAKATAKVPTQKAKPKTKSRVKAKSAPKKATRGAAPGKQTPRRAAPKKKATRRAAPKKKATRRASPKKTKTRGRTRAKK